MIRQAIAAGAIIAVAPLAPANADAILTIPGAWVGPKDIEVPWSDDAWAPEIGSGYYDLPGVTPEVIQYHRDPFLAVDYNINQGADLALARIDAELAADPNARIIVASQSQGTLVSEEVKRRLAADPKYAGADVEFIQSGSPRGLAEDLRIPNGTTIPGFQFTMRPEEVTEYDTVWVSGEYDLWADPPDRLNPVSWANSAVATAYVHNQSALSDRDDAVLVSETVNAKGGKVTRYRVPTKDLPLTQPLRDLGVDTRGMDSVLRPVVDSGYSRNDKPDRVDRQGEQKPSANRIRTEPKKTLREKRQSLRAKVASALGKKPKTDSSSSKGDSES